MKKISALFLMLSGLHYPAAYAAEDIALTAEQFKSLGIETSVLAPDLQADGKGLPAQVVIPPAQLQVVSTPLSGLIESLLVAVNQKVQKGQALARLQSPALIEAQRAFLQAGTQEQLARDVLNRDAQLFKEGIIAKSRYSASQNAHAETSANLSERLNMLKLYGINEAAIGRLKASRTLSSVVEIVSPGDGIVLEQVALAGQRVEAGAPLFKLAQLTPLWLEIQAPLSALAGVSEGATVTVPAEEATGKVLSLGSSVAAGSQTVLLRAEITEGVKNLRPGQFVEASISSASPQGKSWRIPNSALVRQQGKAYVFVQTPKGFRAQEVTLMSEGAKQSVISGALQDNNVIAVAGIAALKASWLGLGGTQ
ncbi:MAG TPA: efflux RND transporter periplasmic adaptor subunit [Gammaproteobacteria bacterium]|nr:efflux RND transporter periplasmic adaptor subunit [Gammaproteobacteria bacterium]